MSVAFALSVACNRDATSSSVHPDPTPSESTPKKTATPEHVRPSLSVPAPPGEDVDAPGGWVPLISVRPDGTIRFGMDDALPDPNPAWTLRLKTDHVEDGKGAEILACRGATVVSEGEVIAHFVPGGFEDAGKRVTLGLGGVATLSFHSGETSTMRFEGVADGDVCTAALLYYVIPVPSAH